MSQREVKQKLYELVCKYFALLEKRGNIVWGKTKAVKPDSPMIALGMTGKTRPSRPNRQYIDGVPHDSYPSKTTLSIDLYTKGASTSDEPGVISRNENTAVSDLTDFSNFLNSVYVDHWCGRTGISLRTHGVQDLTVLTHGKSWEYRALLEVEVGFMQTASGYTAINFEGGIPLHDTGEFAPNPSGGGSQELADDFTGYFEQVEIEEKEASKHGK